MAHGQAAGTGRHAIGTYACTHEPMRRARHVHACATVPSHVHARGHAPLPPILSTYTLFLLFLLGSLLPGAAPSGAHAQAAASVDAAPYTPRMPPWDPAARMAHVRVDARPLSELLPGVLEAWAFSLPEAGVHAGAVYSGGRARLRHVLRDLMAGGHKVKVGFIGELSVA